MSVACFGMPCDVNVLLNPLSLQGLHAIIRNKECPRGEFIFYSSRLIGLAMEYAIRYSCLGTLSFSYP